VKALDLPLTSKDKIKNKKRKSISLKIVGLCIYLIFETIIRNVITHYSQWLGLNTSPSPVSQVTHVQFSHVKPSIVQPTQPTQLVPQRCPSVLQQVKTKMLTYTFYVTLHLYHTT